LLSSFITFFSLISFFFLFSFSEAGSNAQNSANSDGSSRTRRSFAERRTMSKLNLEEAVDNALRATTSVDSVFASGPTEISAPTFVEQPERSLSSEAYAPSTLAAARSKSPSRHATFLTSKRRTLSKFSSFFGINRKKNASTSVSPLVIDCIGKGKRFVCVFVIFYFFLSFLCLEYIEKHGLDCHGLFRIGGSVTQVKLLRRAYEKGMRFFFLLQTSIDIFRVETVIIHFSGKPVSLEKTCSDVHTVTGLLKNFLGE
jgi:hypothetical protein